MILATKSGWLIACTLVSETPRTYTIQEWGESYTRKVPKKSSTEKLFDCVYKAQKWIKEG